MIYSVWHKNVISIHSLVYSATVSKQSYRLHGSVQLLSHVRFCDHMNHSTPGLPVHHQLPEFTQTHVHWVADAIQPFHPLSSPSPPAINLSQHQGLFKWVSSLHQVAKVLEFQLQYQSLHKATIKQSYCCLFIINHYLCKKIWIFTLSFHFDI